MGLSALTGGLKGCSPLNLLYGAEMVGKVTSSASTIRMVGGDLCTPSTRFRLLYDTVSRQQPDDYSLSKPAVSGFEAHSAINFDLDSLSPGTRYYYRVGIDEGDGWNFRDECNFVTQRPPGSSFRFCIGTDLHVYPFPFFDSGRRQLYANIANDGPDLLITLGDEIYLANQREQEYSWSDTEVIWNTTKECRNFLDLACSSMSYLPVNGNHEGLFGWFQDTPGYQEILDAKHAYYPVPDSGTHHEGGDPLGRYGAFTWGDALFIWLDVVGFCPEDPWAAPKDNGKYILGTAQETFLENTLAANASVPWKFIFSHHLFGGVDACSKGYGRGNAGGAFQYDQAFIQALMETYGVQAFFYGHDHVYSVSEANNTAYVCAGNSSSGCPWVEKLDACYAPNLVFAVNENRKAIPGHVRVDVGPASATISYVQKTWGTDNGTVYHSHVIHL